MSKRTTTKNNAWRKKKYRASGYEKKRYERKTSWIEDQQSSFASSRKTEEIVKVRMMSTPEKIDGFRRMMEFCQEIGMCEVISFSEMLTIQGSDKYLRAYSEVNVKEGVDNE